MKYTTITATATFLATLATAQTPADYSPSASALLEVKYGNTTVTPGVLLPQALVSTQPSISTSQKLSGTHMIVFIDLSIAAGPRYANSTAPLAVGYGTCRTTRLHWLATDLTQTPSGALVNGSAPVAVYGGPMPPLNDIPHAYAFYLFQQPENFSLPAWDAGRDVFASGAAGRVNYSVAAIEAVAGKAVAGNYIRTQNPMNNATGSYDNGTCPPSLSGRGPNDSSVVGTAATPVPYTGSAGRMATWSGVVLALGGVVAFALL